MLSRPLLAASLLAASLLVAVGCSDGGDKFTCTLGDTFCTDSSGSPSRDGDHITRCEGPNSGGDENGEFVVLENCAESDNQVCHEDFRRGLSARVNCIRAICAEDTVEDCGEIGLSRCNIRDVLQTCQLDNGSGCNRWMDEPSCSGSCVTDDAADEAVCDEN